MNKIKKIFHAQVVILLSISLLPLQADAVKIRRVLHVSADSWCPISCDASPKGPGIGIELAKAIYEPLGYHITYTIEPWTRALYNIHHGKADIIIGANAHDDLSLIVPKTALANGRYHFYALTSKKLKNIPLKALQTKRIGTIQGYGYGPLNAFIKTQQLKPSMVQSTSGQDALQQNIMKLLADRIDVIAENSLVMEDRLAQLDFSDLIEPIATAPESAIYLAFSAKSSESRSLANQFDAGMATLAKTGALNKIYQRYRLQPIKSMKVSHAN